MLCAVHSCVGVMFDRNFSSQSITGGFTNSLSGGADYLTMTPALLSPVTQPQFSAWMKLRRPCLC